MTLEVHQVGDFVASFVPSPADFVHLDRQFRIQRGILERLPQYADWGFAVFQLAQTNGTQRVHPMGLEFWTRYPDRLFFPTLHIHDGEIHADAEFSHTLYAQRVPPTRRRADVQDPWVAPPPFASPLPPATAELLEPVTPMVRCTINGTRRNQDTWATIQVA
jgi:hypothetical protein